MAKKKTKSAPPKKKAKAPTKKPAASKNAKAAKSNSKSKASKKAATKAPSKKVKAPPKSEWLTVTWREEDVRGALEEHGIPPTAQNLKVLRDSIEEVCGAVVKDAILNSPGLHWET